MNKICGFYISSIHLVTMILPYLKEQLVKETNIVTFFEYNLNENINTVLSNLIINEKEKQDILNINWKNSKIKRYTNIEKNLKYLIECKKDINIIISGNQKYISETNKMLDKFFKKYNYRKVTIINCYEVTEFDDNIRDILDTHNYILNTSGIHKIEDIFENYKKEKAN